MNKKFLNAVIEIMSTYDEAMNAEIFNIFASNRDNIDFGLIKNGVYVFNMTDNSQAAQAVKKFGFDVLTKFEHFAYMTEVYQQLLQYRRIWN